MAQPQITKTKWSPQQGGLISDIDPKDLSGGNLLVNGVNTGGMNVRNVGKGQNVMMDYEPIYGNEYVYTPDTVVVQNKKWRINVDTSQAPLLIGQPNIINNGDFSSGLTGWTSAIPGAWVANVGPPTNAQHIPGPGNGSSFYQNQTGITPGFYNVQFEIINRTAGYVSLPLSNFSNTQYTANGTYVAELSVVVETTGSFSVLFYADDNFDGGITNIVVKKVAEVYAFTPYLGTSSGTQLNFTFPFYWPIYNNIQSSLTGISNWLQYTNDNISNHSPSSTTVITGPYTGYVEFELTDYPSFDYVFTEKYDDIFSNVTDCVNVVVVQEAIDPSCLGEWNLIGSDDKPTDSFEFWTTRKNLSIDLDIFNVSNPSGTTVRVTTVDPHGLVNNEAVDITGVIGVPEANGIWTVTVFDAFSFDLNNCVFIGTPYVSGGVVRTDIYGLGEIGVAVEDNQGVISYTRLLRSKEFNFSTLKQIDCRAKRKQDIQKFAVYYTDNFNLPRVFYYKGAYQPDGALNYISPENIYDYGSISSESRWILSNAEFRISWIEQIQSGGQLKSGNWRYAARLLTFNFTATEWSFMTETVPVFKDSTGDDNMIGSNPDTVTPKINVLRIDILNPESFAYVEVAAINYLSDIATTGYIIGQYAINQANTELIVSHTGSETYSNLDLGSLIDFSPVFLKAQNVELLDNRAILSNLTPAAIYDFSEWVKTFKYSLETKTLDAVGAWDNNNPTVNEYRLPLNVYEYKSHMLLETYRYGFRFKLKNGYITDVFYPGYDIKFDLPSLPDISRPERLAGTFTSFALSSQAPSGSAPPTSAYSFYIRWQNINLDYKIDGVSAKELISEIVPCRATVVPESLFSGNIALGVSGTSSYYNPDSPGVSNQVYDDRFYGTTVPAPTPVGPYPYISGEYYSVSDIYPGTFQFAPNPPNGMNAERKYAFLYSPDFHFTRSTVTYQNGDQLFVFNQPRRHNRFTYGIGSGDIFQSYYCEYDGWNSITTNITPYNIVKSSPARFPANAGKTTAYPYYNTGTASMTNTVWRQYYNLNISGLLTMPFLNEECIMLEVDSNIAHAGDTDYGFYMAIYHRPLVNKYGDPLSTIYTYTCKPYVITDEDMSSVFLVNDFDTYGDVFTQKTWLKYRYPGWWQRAQEPSDFNDCWGTGVGYYSQNRGNYQLRCLPTETYNASQVIYRQSRFDWVSKGWAIAGSGLGWDSNRFKYVPPGVGKDSQLFYNRGYDARDGITSARTFNGLLEYQTDWGNAIAWSDPESEGSNADSLRNFPPLNLKFLDYTQGSISDARALNGELVTIQAREVQRQYFDTTAVLTTQNGGEAYLGTGAVLSRRGATMNKFGSRHKWSIIMGLSDKGGDVLYGIDDINNTVWRLGYDGTNSLDEIQGMKSFFANNLYWIRGKYTPAHDEGIRGVANQRYREVIWTLRGRKQFPEWQAEDNFCQLFSFESNIGNEIVFNGNFTESGSLVGWESLDGTFPYASNLTWQMQYVFAISGYAANKDGTGEGYLTQSTPLPLEVGHVYVVQIDVPIAPTLPITVSFQLGGPTAYSITTAGTHIFTYTAVSGDDNICIYSPLGSDAFITNISIRESLQTGANWSGGLDWVISNNEACTVSPPAVATSLIQNTPDYILPNYPYILTFRVSGTTISGDLRVTIGNVTSPPVGIGPTPATYSVGVSPTATGVIRFNPDPTFEGCIQGNIKLCTSGVLKVYNTGDIVQTSDYGGIMSTWSQTPDIWICLKDGVTSNPYFPPDPDDPDWQLIPHTNPNYYTEYTIVYNELKNKFQTFMTILPKIYAHFQDGYLVPKPISNTGRMYVSDTGIPTTWFDTNTGDAYLDAVINSPAGRKRYLAARVESDVAPTSMTVTSSSGSSVTSSGEFEQREGQEFDGYVKDTSTESIIMGDFGIFRFTFAAGTYNKLNSFIASVRERARKWFR